MVLLHLIYFYSFRTQVFNFNSDKKWIFENKNLKSAIAKQSNKSPKSVQKYLSAMPLKVMLSHERQWVKKRDSSA